jgi:FKBP-type peptidyl-prolyl cis-trans isomerase SlyD
MEKATLDRPLSFIFGAGMMLEAFEDKLRNLEPGSTFDFTLSSDQAYGEYFNENVVELPRSVFEVDGEIDESIIFENNTVPMMDQEGNQYNGTIVSIGDESITMDFNHPLAGEKLHFIGQVIEVREATEEDMKQLMGGCNCSKEDCDCDDEAEGSCCGGCGSH